MSPERLEQCGVRRAACGVSRAAVGREVERRRRFIRVTKIAGLVFVEETPHTAHRTPHATASAASKN